VRVLLIAAILAALSVPARSECLSSASAVWAVHPGSHPNWRLRLPGHVGEKCWYAKNSTDLPAPQVQERRVQDSPRRTESDSRGEVKASTADQPNETARSESQETSRPQQRGPTSILIWGRPMGLDPAWQEIFARRVPPSDRRPEHCGQNLLRSVGPAVRPSVSTRSLWDGSSLRASFA
jgi:hypothetical protein